jgi:hypothetical protein
VDECNVGTLYCTEIMEGCGCEAEVDCINVESDGPAGGRPRNGPGPGRPNGDGSDERLNGLCQKMVESSSTTGTCPTRNGGCPSKAICRAGEGTVATFCGAVGALDGCDHSLIDCEDLEWGGVM